MAAIARRFMAFAEFILSSRYFIPACLVAAITVRLTWITLNPVVPTTDWAWYYGQALRISQGYGYTVNDHHFPLTQDNAVVSEIINTIPTAFWPVGYPAFLGLIMFLLNGVLPPLAIALLLNVILSSLVVWLGYLCCRTIFDSELAGRGTMLLLAIYPNHIAYTALTSSEIYYLFLALLGTALLLQMQNNVSILKACVTGFVFGLATLTKPQAIFLPAILLIIINIKKPRQVFLTGAALYMTILLTISPWLIRNYLAFNEFVFISNNGGINLLIGNNPKADGTYAWNNNENPNLQLIESIKNEKERDSRARQIALEYIWNHPLEAVSRVPRKLEHLYKADVDGFGWTMFSAGSIKSKWFWLSARIFSQAFYVCVCIGFFLSMFFFARQYHPIFWVGPVTVLYFTLIYMVFFGGSRFHFAMVAWFVAYTGSALGLAISNWRDAQSEMS